MLCAKLISFPFSARIPRVQLTFDDFKYEPALTNKSISIISEQKPAPSVSEIENNSAVGVSPAINVRPLPADLLDRLDSLRKYYKSMVPPGSPDESAVKRKLADSRISRVSYNESRDTRRLHMLYTADRYVRKLIDLIFSYSKSYSEQISDKISQELKAIKKTVTYKTYLHDIDIIKFLVGRFK